VSPARAGPPSPSLAPVALVTTLAPPAVARNAHLTHSVPATYLHYLHGGTGQTARAAV